MLWKILSAILVFWFICFVARIGGLYIHWVLVIAGALFVVQIIAGRSLTKS